MKKVKYVGQKFSDINVVYNVVQSVMGGNVVYRTKLTFDSSFLKYFNKTIQLDCVILF